MKKIFAIGFAALVLIIIGMFIYYYFINISFYTPGELSKNANILLDPPDQAGSAEHYWQVEDDISLYHFEVGQGQPVLVVHGGPGIPYEQPWAGLESLTNDYKFFYYDQRGCGQSTRPIEKFESKNYYQNMKDLDTNLGMGQQIADIERIRKILGQDQLIIIGHSYGGFMATLYALEFPENVSRLILINPAGVLRMPQADDELNMFAMMEAGLSSDDQVGFQAWQQEYLDFSHLFNKNEKTLQQLNYEFVEYYQKYLVKKGMAFIDKDRPKLENMGGFMVQALYLSLGRSYDYRSKLLNIETPTMIIQGAKDFGTKTAFEYDASLGNSKLEIMENAGHFVYNQIPAEFGDRVGNFLRR